MIALTGASGVLGSALSRRWMGRAMTTFRGDIRNFDEVLNWVREAGGGELAHCAAIVPVARVVAGPLAAFEVNVQGTTNICEAVRIAAPGTWLFFASSSHVYSSSPDPIREEWPADPITLYGASKLAAEQVALAYAREFGMTVCVGRIFSFSDPGQSAQYLLPSLVQRIRACPRGGTLALQGAMQMRDFLTAEQVAGVIDCLREKGAAGVFNVASGHGVKLLDLAVRLAARMDRRDISIEAADEKDTRLIANVSKLEQIGCAPQFHIDELIEQVAV